MEIEFSEHAVQRMEMRNLSEQDINMALVFGYRRNDGDCWIYEIRYGDIRKLNLGIRETMRLVGVTVVISKNNRTIVTAWRDARRLRKLQRKRCYHQELSSLQPSSWSG